jgi:hypothetical protein
MKKTRTAAKWFVGSALATALLIGSTALPAQARDTGWNPVREQDSTSTAKDTKTKDSTSSTMRDTGWNPV